MSDPSDSLAFPVSMSARAAAVMMSRRAALGAMLAGVAAGSSIARAESAVQTVTAKRLPSPTGRDPLSLAIAAAIRGQAAAEAMAGYSATLIKRERIGGTLIASEMRMKLRHDPLAVYLRFIEPHDGRQILYRENANDGKMLVRQTGLASFLGTMSVAPNDPLALKENRHAITEAGMANLAAKTAAQWSALATAAVPPMVKRYPNARFDDYECEAFEVTAGDRTTPLAKSRLFLDAATGLPVRAQRYERARAEGQPPVLVEDYAYLTLDLRSRLTAADFSPANPAYGFE